MSWWRFRRALLALAVVSIGLTGCAKHPQSMLYAAGPLAKAELHLFGFGGWIMLGIAVLVCTLLIVILVKFRSRPDDDELPPQVEGNHRLEISWTIGFIIILAVLVVPNVHDTFYAGDVSAQANSLPVTVVGHQWWWEFQYPGQHIVTANELHIPTGRPIALSLQSADVIHSFWVPALGGKTDLVPGRTNSMWIEASKAGVYDGQCLQFCGTSHANMRFQVVAETPAQFQQWVHTMQQPYKPPTTTLAKQGEQLFMKTEPCAACHTIDGTSAQGKVGPNLTNVGARRMIAAGVLPNTNANLARWLHDPQAVKPGTYMPNLHLSQAQIQALVAYLRTRTG